MNKVFSPGTRRVRRGDKHPSGAGGGFTLVELLIVVAVIGLLTAIMIPNMIDAMHKAKQKRTMTDMRQIGAGWLSWVTDQVGASSAGQAKTYDPSELGEITYAQLHGRLRPTNTFFYVQDLPQIDGWQEAYRFHQNPAAEGAQVMMICSRARDKTFDTCDEAQIPVSAFESTNYDTDIIWADGFFIRWPSGGGR